MAESEHGPSWWCTRAISSSSTPQSSREYSDTEWFILFEYFPCNARKFELLRISVSDGFTAHDGAFSHDEVFVGNRSSSQGSSSRMTSEEMQILLMQAIEGENGGRVSVEKDAVSREGVVVVVRSDSFKSRVLLEMKDEIDQMVFVDRTMDYVKYVQAELQQENENLRTVGKKRDALLEEVNTKAQKKQDEDAEIEFGLAQLMEEKRLYWSKRSG